MQSKATRQNNSSEKIGRLPEKWQPAEIFSPKKMLDKYLYTEK